MQPLHVAILHAQPEAVAALLRLGADPRGACPDCYPSYASWKRQRGVQAMQVRRWWHHRRLGGRWRAALLWSWGRLADAWLFLSCMLDPPGRLPACFHASFPLPAFPSCPTGSV